MRQQQNTRQHHGAEGIDMFQRIEADAAELPGGVVTQPVRDKSVRGFVKGDRDDERQHPDRQRIE